MSTGAVEGPPLTTLQAAPNSRLCAVVQAGGAYLWDGGSSVIRDVVIDGNGSNNGTANSSSCIE